MKLRTFATTAIALTATAVLGLATPLVTAQSVHPVVAQSSSCAISMFSDTELRCSPGVVGQRH
jgi:hypothetical protein